MPNSSKLLDQGFKKALQEAATLDQQRVTRDDDFGLFPDHVLSNVELVQACADFYDQHQIVIDAALENAVKFLGGPHGVAHVKALQASFESPELNPLSVELASKILRSEEFSFTNSPDGLQGLVGIGIGVSAGAAIPKAGVFAGADIVFEKDDIILRAWAGANGPDTPGTGSASIGLELSFFTNTPTTGVIIGSLVDVYVPIEDFPLVVFLRLALIQQQVTEGGPFISCGLSIQIPLGINWQPQKPVTANFAAKQWTSKPKPQFATLTVAPSQIVSKAAATSLLIKLTNTSTQDVPLQKGDKITINMPSYFQPTDVGNMKLDLPGWTLSQAGNKLILTLANNWTWKDQATIPGPAGFNITNVRTTVAPSSGDFQIGDVMLVLTYSGSKIPVVKNAGLDLVNRISTGTIISWNVDLGPNSDFEVAPGQPSQGANVPITSKPGSVFQPLTVLNRKGSQQPAWNLGYVFDADPRLAAVQFKANTIRLPITFFSGTAVGGAGGTSSCFYTGLQNTLPEINITVGPLKVT